MLHESIFAQRSSVAANRHHWVSDWTNHSHGITGRKRLLYLGYQVYLHKFSKKSHALPSLSPMLGIEELLVQVQPTRTVLINSN